MNNLSLIILACLFFYSCANGNARPLNNSYQLIEQNGECKGGGSLAVSDHMRMSREIMRDMGLDCFSSPVTLANQKQMLRVICNQPDKQVPAGISIVENKESCEIAKKLIAKNPSAGLQNNDRQMMEAQNWIVNLKEDNCMPTPFSAEGLQHQLQRMRKEACRISVEKFSLGTLKRISCGPTSSANVWVLSESEELCRDFLKAQ